MRPRPTGRRDSTAEIDGGNEIERGRRRYHTKSSPTGPAEQEEGGSLQVLISIKSHSKRKKVGILPAQISEFLVNALKSHDDEKVRERIEGERDWK